MTECEAEHLSSRTLDQPLCSIDKRVFKETSMAPVSYILYVLLNGWLYLSLNLANSYGFR